MDRYADMFARLNEQNEGAFVPFVMIGDPDLETSEKIITQLIESGADALELGGELFNKHHWQIHPCSAVTGKGLVEGMDWIVDDISSRIFLSD